MRRHLREWRAVLLEAGDQITWRSWLKMIRGALSRPVPMRRWRQRARVCVKCPLYDRELRRCAGPWVNDRPTGCWCYLLFLLRMPKPYPKGCWGRQYVGEDFGWN